MRITAVLVLVLASIACGDAADRETPPPGGTPGPGGEAVPDPTGDRPAAEDPGSAGPDPDSHTGTDPGSGATVRVWFSRGEAPVAVDRQVPDGGPEAALSALVRGPTAAERAAGLDSWFSEATAGSLARVQEQDGFLVVDFRGLDRLIPGAGSSAGSAGLLESLDSTVFQFPSVRSVEYRLDGSCDAFWAWLQRACERVGRP